MSGAGGRERAGGSEGAGAPGGASGGGSEGAGAPGGAGGGGDRAARGRPRDRQAKILTERYLETVLADRLGTGILLAQAPILAGLTVLVWENLGRPTAGLYFVMTLSVIWIGCVDACREIVKEKQLFLRERMAGLRVAPYLASKMAVLSVLGAVQVAIYAAVIASQIDVRIGPVWLFLSLFAAALASASLGLAISAVVSRSDHAVALVPFALVPQILFSEFAIGGDHFRGASEVAYRLMPSRWGYESLRDLADPGAGLAAGLVKLAPLFAFSLAFVAAAAPILAAKRY